MKPYTRSVIELFDGKRRYLIPLYQRQYAWKAEPQLQYLWEDIQNAINKINIDRTTLTPHFMGAIVINQIKTYGKEVQAYEVIDGQQRLTTFQILLAALRDIARRYNSTYGAEVHKYILNEGIMSIEEVECYKLWPSLMDRKSLAAILNPDADLSFLDIPRQISDQATKLSTEAYNYFYEKLNSHVISSNGSFEEHRLELFFEALKEGLAVVSIELEGGDDPQTIFETLNSRGVDLTAGDLMRNFIFQRAKNLGQSTGSLAIDKLYANYWQPLDESFWQVLYSRGRHNRTRLDWMLNDHISVHLADNISVDNLFQTYRKWITDQSPFSDTEAELKSISETAGIEKLLFEQSSDNLLGHFGRFAEAFDVSTVIPLVVHIAKAIENDDQLAQALAIIRSYITRRDICGLTNKNYNRFFIGTIPYLREGRSNIPESLRSYFSSKSSDVDCWPTNSVFRTGWLSRAQYKNSRQPRLRFVLESIERNKRTELNEVIEIKTDLTIEHIMPQKWRENWPLEPATDQAELDDLLREHTRDTCINRMGNLTLLTQKLNSSVSNGPFNVKMPAVRSHSSLTLNRELNDYPVWDERSIEQRGISLFETALKIWESPDREGN